MKLSIVVPTLNEAACLADTLSGALRLPGDVEVLVTDGGSSDDTTAIASNLGVRCVESPRGRGRQLNAGAAHASGDVLLFLHADTRLPPAAYDLVRHALRDPEVVGGCFRLRFDGDQTMLRLYGWFTRFSFPLFHYGDEAFFVRAGVFERLRGFQPFPIMEDLDFWLRLRRHGRVAIIPTPVVTSARRFVRNGTVRQQVVSAGLLLLFLVGVSPYRLKRYYDDVR